jgi:hypothetical protein
VADDQERLLTDDPVDQPEQDLQDVVGAVDGVGCGGAAHAGQVWVDAPVAGPVGEQRLQAAGHLAVVHVHAVQPEDWGSAAVLDELYRDAVDDGFHGWTFYHPRTTVRPRAYWAACRSM